MGREVGHDSRTLCAILLNPALRPAPETISYRNLGCALPLVGCGRIRLANLLDVPTKDQVQLGATVIEAFEVARSRALLAEAVLAADEILFAWGANRVTGRTGVVLREQVSWLRRHLKDTGVRRTWMVAGTPRHPSRWRQYVGPEKARVEGSTFEDRLAKVLAAHPLE
ncbi:DUF1643 domain-containing protein [Streptosporangium sp. NPDC023825]|uniref:DUF1643 domain-containing protein n=1 Tax=Streptosporangium sp. NPDC023825 TaxID=3154909 RepID=UPI003431751A